VYQHLYSTVVLASRLGPGFNGGYVDRKRFDGDVFDDLELPTGGVVRIQVKSHSIPRRPFVLRDLQDSGKFALKNAFLSFVADERPADDYRLVATWQLEQGASVHACIRQSETLSLAPGSETLVLELVADELWPPSGPMALFSSLRKVGTRDQFIEFCQRFRIELNAPSASLDIGNPGPLELLLFSVLRERLGVGLWPNQDREVDEAADSAIYAVVRANARDSWLAAAELYQVLNLTTDYGRVPQEFPIDQRWQVSRQEQLDELLRLTDTTSRVLVTGAPGSGKSWLLNDLAQQARQDGRAVALHFCYLDLLDPSRRLRATVETTIGNLIADLADSCEYEQPGDIPLYSARPSDLVAHAEAAATARPGHRVLLIVDGLDHVSRVDPVAIGRTSASETLARALASIELPPSVCLILGSQPGAFLDCLENADRWTVAPWEVDDCASLLQRTEVEGSSEELKEAAELLSVRSGGNPLYLTYLAREVERLSDVRGALDLQSVSRLLDALPAYDEGLSGYYTHLLDGVRTAVGSSQLVDMLALIDFPLSARELGEVLPSAAHEVAATVKALVPVLSDSPLHGGLRIYHESFQRFVREQLSSRGAEFSAILDPVITWLELRGIFRDSRSFRSLARTLILAGRIGDSYSLLTTEFVAHSVAAGFGFSAIRQVLKDVATAAGRESRWDVLVRINELMNSANTCFDGKLVDDVALEFARTLATVNEPALIAERLVYDGRPEWGHRTGLLLCAFCDEAGATPPWDIYLQAYARRDDKNTIYGDSSDDLVEASILRGRLRRSRPAYMIQRTIDVLNETEDVRPSVLTMGATVAQVLGPDALDEVIEAVSGTNQARLLLAKAGYLKARRVEGFANIAQKADAIGLDDRDSWLALVLGAESSSSVDLNDLLKATQAVLSEKAQFEEEIVARWLRLVNQATSADLLGVERLLSGPGWYRCWLRYWVSLQDCGRDGRVLESFRQLEVDVSPYVGTPRACDLLSLRGLIHDTLRVGLSKADEEDWREVLGILVHVSRKTTTYMQGGSGGPLTLVPLLKMMLDEAGTEAKALVSAELARGLVADGNHETTYYETHAHSELVRAQAELILGERAQALTSLAQASRYLVAYGFHKDITIFGLLDSLESLHTNDDKQWARVRLASLQAPIEALLTHTDLKETQHAFSRWYELIGRLDPIGALSHYAAKTRRAFARIDSWVEVALRDALANNCLADPLHQIAGSLCLVSAEEADWPQSPEPSLSEVAARRLIRTAVISDNQQSLRSSDPVRPQREPAVVPGAGCTLDELCVSIGRIRWTDAREEDFHAIADLALCALTSVERPQEVLLQIAEASESYRENRVMEILADGLLADGHVELAAACKVFAFTRSGDGWRHFGHESRLELLVEAYAIEDATASETLAGDAIDMIFARPGWNGITEMMPEVVALIRPGDAARVVWDEAFSVIEYRLPATGRADHVATAYRPCEHDGVIEANQAVAELVLSRLQHISFERRARAVAAAALLFADADQTVWPALGATIACDMSVSALSILLSLVTDFGVATDMPAHQLELVRHAEASELLCLRVPARRILSLLGEQVLSPAPLLPSDRAPHGPRRKIPRRWQLAGEVWPELPELVARESDSLPREPWVRRWMEVFVDSVTSPSSRQAWGRTWSPFDEGTEIALSRIAASVRPALAMKGTINPAAEDDLGEMILPSWPLRVRYQLSRADRPRGLVIPAEASEGNLPELEQTLNEDATYPGWIRVAHIEHERREAETYRDRSREAAAFSGLWFGPPYDSGLPYGHGVSRSWLRETSGSWPRGFMGPVAGLAAEQDYCGAMQVLTLHPKLIQAHGLSPAEWWDGLLLLDEDGLPAAVCRLWAGPFTTGVDLGKEFPTFEGAELLLRPDILRSIEELAGQKGQWVQQSASLAQVEDDE